MKLLLSTLIVAALAGATGLSQEPPARPVLPPAAVRPIDFAQDVAPILSRSCVRCHARGQSKGRFSLETREGLLKGGRAGAAIEPGNSADSLLVHLVSGLDPDLIMPEKGSRLSATDIGVLRAWIDQGAAWDDRVSFARQPPRNLAARQPSLPPVHGDLTHPVDRLLAAHPDSAAAGALRADDRVLVRRLYLDLIGVLPTSDEVESFVRDTQADKVTTLAGVLLDDRARYATHWLSFWNDLLRNDYRGPGYIDGGRRQISGWLYTALADNMPFDQFVTELVNPGPRSEGFARGIIWRGVVNASQTPPMQAAQNISQVFMGVNLKCASCHDSFINDWQLADAYGLAGVFAEKTLEMVECDRPTGKTAPLKFLYPELGTIDADAARAERVRQLAQVMVDRNNGRLSRTIVNRLWARLLGRGLVEPLDDMDRPAWHPDLLDWLAEDLVAHGYDLKHTLLQIVTSQAYQRRAVDVEAPGADGGVSASTSAMFTGPLVRRMTAEQFVDALGAVTGVWQGTPSGEFEVDIANGREPLHIGAPWIWRNARPGLARRPRTIYFRTTVDLSERPAVARLYIGHPRQFALHVNGKKVAEGGTASRPRIVDAGRYLTAGHNVLALAVGEAARPSRPARRVPAEGDEFRLPPAPPLPTPRALQVELFVGDARAETGDAPLVSVLQTDDTWRWLDRKVYGWEQPQFPDDTWRTAVHATGPDLLPVDYEREVQRTLALDALHGRARAAVTVASPLTTALGRPTREQVVTVRSDAPTTLQALELANGETFASLVRRGAARLRREPATSPDDLATRIYRRALGRPPSPREAAIARDVLGVSPDVAAVEDLLWAVVMLPEFRLIH